MPLPGPAVPLSARVGLNPINPGTADLHRQVVDLQTFGTAPIAFSRIYDSRTTNFNDPYWDFGSRQTWQHNWNYEVRQLSSKTFNQFDIKVRYPDGREYNFVAPDATSSQRVPPAECGDRLYKWSGGSVGYTLITPEGMELDFYRYLSPAFHLTQVRDGQGLAWNLTYGSDQKLNRIANQFGRWLQIERTLVSGVSCITRVYTSDGRQVAYTYSPWTPTSTIVLTGVTYPGTETASYTWVTADPTSPSARPLLETASDPMYGGPGSLTRYVYNYDAKFDYGSGSYLVTGTIKEERNLTTGALIVSLPLGGGSYPQILEGNGTEITRKFNKGQINTIADGEGRSVTYARDNAGYGFIQSATESQGNVNFGVTSYTRDFAGRILTRTDALNHTRSFTYNTAGYELTRSDERNFTTTTTRDAGNRPIRIDYPDGAYETWTYNTFGQILSHRARSGGTQSLVYYNGSETGGMLGDVKTRTDALSNVTTYTYANSGLLSSVMDARNFTTSYAYNWRGLLLTKTQPDNSTVTYAYDTFGNRTSITNELGKVWTTTYNEYQRVATRKDPLNRVTRYEYGMEPGCSSCAFANTLSLVTLPSGKKTAFTYDRSWKRTSQTVGAGTSDAATTSYGYDGEGDMVTTTDGRGKIMGYTYDLLHRRLASTDPLNHTSSTAYDPAGNVLSQTRADNEVTIYEYDAMNRRTKETDPLNQVTQMAYDAAGNLGTLTDAKNNAYGFTYDLLNRKTSMIYPGGSHEDWTYDPVGSGATYHNRAGQILTKTYDSRNRLTNESWSANGVTSIPLPSARTRIYDVAGRLISFYGTEFGLNYAYDFANQLNYEVQEFSNVNSQAQAEVDYSYDLDGNRATMNAADSDQSWAPTVSYSYTARNQMSSISLAGSSSPLATFTYDLSGNRLTRTLENGTSAFYSYDDANRLTTLDHRFGASSIAKYDYTYNTVNDRTSRGEAINGGGAQTDTYGYDSTDQVTSTSYASGRNVVYNYDPVGNRTVVTDSVTPAVQPGSYTTNNLNQYTATSPGATLNYDANGNLLNSPFTVIYDAQSRAVANVGDEQVYYDGTNRVIARGNDGHGIQSPEYQTYIYDGWNIIEDYDTVTGKMAVYVHGPQVDELLCKLDGVGGRVYYSQDALGSVTALTDNAGVVSEHYTYDVYGKPKIYNGTNMLLNFTAYGNRFLFTGREWFSASSLYDYRNRLYSPTLGKFLQMDPIRFDARDVNLYRYVFDCPTRLRDPLGLYRCWDEAMFEDCTSYAEKQLDKCLDTCTGVYDAGMAFWQAKEARCEWACSLLPVKFQPFCKMACDSSFQAAYKSVLLVYTACLASCNVEYAGAIAGCASSAYRESSCPCN